MRKGSKRTPWTRRHALKLLEKSGVESPVKAYNKLRTKWIGTTELPSELKVHLTLAAAICEWLGDLSQLQIIRLIEQSSRGGDSSDAEKALSSTLPLLTSDFGAILTLCRAGYDVQARIVLRSFIERVDLLICLILDADLARSYINAQSFEDSRSFFYKYISGGKLSRRARTLFSVKFPHATFISEWLLVEWREETSLMLASAAHANHTVAMISLFPNLGRGPSQAIGLQGHPTNGSNTTIAKLLFACMPLYFLFEDYPYSEIVSYMQESGLSTSDIAYFRSFFKLILLFPLVDTWLKDLDSALKNHSDSENTAV